MKRFVIDLIFLLYVSAASASITVTDGAISLSSGSAIMELSCEHGGIISFTRKGMTKAGYTSSARGLWSAELADGRIDAAQFSATNTVKKFSFEKRGESALDLIYVSQELKVVVHVKEIADGFDLSATATPAHQVLQSMDLPSKLAFDPQIVERFISPSNPNQSVGIAFNQKFFSEQPLDNPTGWQGQSAGSKAFVALYGKAALTLGDDTPPAALKVTEAGVAWLPPDVVKRVNAAKVPVVRPPHTDLCDLTLVASDCGAYFSGSQLGGKGGYIWRIGGGVRGEVQELIAEEVVLATVRKLMEGAPEGRGEIALLDLKNGPMEGSWNSTKIEKWRGLLRRSVSQGSGRFNFESITSIPELERALRSQKHLCIVNPYGEGFPAKDEAGLLATMATLKKFIHAGGHWFESGGYSFYQILHPNKYLDHKAVYPPAYADLFHLESTVGDFAVYRAQSRERAGAWDAAGQPEKIFMPATLYCGGDDSGGYMGRAFTTWVKPEQSWTTPSVQLTAGVSLEKTIADYCAKNSITTPLAKKINAGTLAKFKEAPLLYLAGSCSEKMAALDALPVPSLIHFADYLLGGFDKQYPDHLPPNKAFGTLQELQSFVKALHAKGHLFSPYTNPTWWCDDPKGPTFEREGTASLLVKEDGKNRFEKYGDNPGWTTTLWHPAAQAANRRVREQFIEDVPVDMLFQDQCGARGFLYDFNPAAPTPYAYSEGMISMNDEDSRRVPLGTEHGWDRVSNFQTMQCGMSWGIVPTKGGPAWRKCFKKTLPAETWSIYPLAQAISHDKCVFGHHDLGQFVTDNRSLCWTLALGYHMSWRGNADFVKHSASREWYAWLCRIQRSVASRYTGQPLTGFVHNRAPMLERNIDHSDYNDDGTITAAYGDLTVYANLGPVARNVGGHQLARYGFFAEAPGLTAGILDGRGSRAESAFVMEHKSGHSDLWLYASPGEELAIPVPFEGRVKLIMDGQVPVSLQVAEGQLAIALPQQAKSAPRIEPSEAELTRAPCNRPGDRPCIGVIDLGKTVYPVWAGVSADEWVETIQKSSLCTLHGLEVKRIGSWDELQKAIGEGQQRWISIVNPYGELIVTEKEGGWKQTLDAVRSYVENGGSWWEVGGYSFHTEIYRDDKEWKHGRIESEGLKYMGIQIFTGEIEVVPERITVTRAGERWLGKPFTAKVNQQYAQVNRAMSLKGSTPVTTLIQGQDQLFVGGFRLGGWGHLWRIGGMRPDRDLATSVMIAATLHQYITPPEPIELPAAPQLWHAVVER